MEATMDGTDRSLSRAPGFGFALLVGTGIIWGTIGVAAKLLYRETDLDAVSVTWLRTVIASPVCVALAWSALGRRLFRTARRDLAIMVLLGVLLIVYQWLYLAAVARLGVSVATLIALCLPPVLVAAASAAFLGEPLTTRLIVALMGALVGTALLIGRPADPAASSGATAWGVLLALACAGGLAIHLLASRLLAGRQHPLRPLAIGFPVGAIVFLPVVAGRGISLVQPASGWLVLLYLGLVPSVLAYWMYQRGLRDVSATTASIVTLLEPLAAATLAWLLFGERLGTLGLLGGALLLGAIGLLSLGSARSPHPAPDEVAVV